MRCTGHAPRSKMHTKRERTHIVGPQSARPAKHRCLLAEGLIDVTLAAPIRSPLTVQYFR